MLFYFFLRNHIAGKTLVSTKMFFFRIPFYFMFNCPCWGCSTSDLHSRSNLWVFPAVQKSSIQEAVPALIADPLLSNFWICGEPWRLDDVDCYAELGQHSWTSQGLALHHSSSPHGHTFSSTVPCHWMNTYWAWLRKTVVNRGHMIQLANVEMML